MSIVQSLLPEFDHEFATLRKMLERVPDGKWDYTPHQKSMTLGRLSGHLAELASWTNSTLESDELDFATVPYKPFVPTSPADLLAKLDATVSRARAVLANASDADLMKTWTLRNGGAIFFTMPKAAVMRTFVMNHMIHHRAQLGVYLRLNDIALPSTYGPSADEGQM